MARTVPCHKMTLPKRRKQLGSNQLARLIWLISSIFSPGTSKWSRQVDHLKWQVRLFPWNSSWLLVNPYFKTKPCIVFAEGIIHSINSQHRLPGCFFSMDGQQRRTISHSFQRDLRLIAIQLKHSPEISANFTPQTSPHLHKKVRLSWWFKVAFLGWLSHPFKGLSDLQIGDEKVTAWITWFLYFPGSC